MGKENLDKQLRDSILQFVVDALKKEYDTDDVLPVKSGVFMMPVVDSEQNEKFALIQISIPRGTRSEGSYIPYDGYEAARAYADDQAAIKAEKEAKKEAKEREEKLKEHNRKVRAAKKVIKEMG